MIDTCGCCQVLDSMVPLVFNRPGLTAVNYRIGTFATFLESMIASISSAQVNLHGTIVRPFAERPWTTRDRSDQGIATLEMFAYVAHVLTFYQQTTANEAFLRTATLRESILAMAATLGYVPAPGQAAVAFLAFALERRKQLVVPVALRVQSVPEPGTKPQKFETVASATADASLNTVRVFPLPGPVTALDTGHTSAVLLSSLALRRPAVVGGRLVVFGTSATAVEDKEIIAVQVADGRTRITWSPPIASGGSLARMFQWADKLRLAGQNAPASVLVPTVNSPVDVTFALVTTDFTIPDTASALNLDAVYPDLKPGQQVLIRAPETVVLRTLSDVAQSTDSTGGLTSTVSRIAFTPAIGTAIADRRTVSVYVLGEEILFGPTDYAAQIDANANTVFLEAPNPAIAPGRVLILDDVAQAPLSVTVTSV